MLRRSAGSAAAWCSRSRCGAAAGCGSWCSAAQRDGLLAANDSVERVLHGLREAGGQVLHAVRRGDVDLLVCRLNLLLRRNPLEFDTALIRSRLSAARVARGDEVVVPDFRILSARHWRPAWWRRSGAMSNPPSRARERVRFGDKFLHSCKMAQGRALLRTRIATRSAIRPGAAARPSYTISSSRLVQLLRGRDRRIPILFGRLPRRVAIVAKRIVLRLRHAAGRRRQNRLRLVRCSSIDWRPFNFIAAPPTQSASQHWPSHRKCEQRHH